MNNSVTIIKKLFVAQSLRPKIRTDFHEKRKSPSTRMRLGGSALV